MRRGHDVDDGRTRARALATMRAPFSFYFRRQVSRSRQDAQKRCRASAVPRRNGGAIDDKMYRAASGQGQLLLQAARQLKKGHLALQPAIANSLATYLLPPCYRRRYYISRIIARQRKMSPSPAKKLVGAGKAHEWRLMPDNAMPRHHIFISRSAPMMVKMS